MAAFEMDPVDLVPPHEVTDEVKLAALTSAMLRDGWKGPAVVVALGTWAGDRALTGSHRIPAALAAVIAVPVARVEDVCAEHGVDWLDILDGMCEAGVSDPVEEAAIYVFARLPASVVDHYGLDLH